LHRAGFVHGDVKPDNVRLVDAGSATLIDLGFAHRPGENAHLLRKGYVLGTANYLAPELCACDPAAAYAADLYALGVSLFELLTGRLPYPTGTMAETFRRHRDDAPEDVRKHAPLLPPGLATLVDRLMAKAPAERPKAAGVVQQLVGLEIAELRRRRAA
jgi:serine/threonine protein kinase